MKVKFANDGCSIARKYEEFLFLKQTQGISKTTLDNYRISLKVFLDQNPTISEFDDVNVITKNVILNWISERQEAGEKTVTINHHLTSMRVFLYWLMEEGEIPSYKIHLVKGQETQLKYYTDSELKILLRKPTKKDSFRDWRTYTIICFILGTGARASTVCNIKWEDIDFENGSIFYRHLKNKSISMVPLSNSLASVLKEYMNMFQWTKKEWLFTDFNENQLTPNASHQALHMYCKNRNIRALGQHALRHSYARLSIVNGMSAFQLKRQLTHSTIQMTNRYVHLFDEDMKNGYEDICPLDNLAEHRVKRA